MDGEELVFIWVGVSQAATGTIVNIINPHVGRGQVSDGTLRASQSYRASLQRMEVSELVVVLA